MTIRTLALTFLVALLGLAATPDAPRAEAAAPWPESARGRPLPRPAWVLVIPARRKADGGLAIWERADPWTKAWRVPRLVSGIRMVTLLGDAEDRRSVTAEAIDGMVVDSLSVVMRKYGAPALALAVSDGDAVALAGYVPGSPASWEPVDSGKDVDDTRTRSLSALASLFGARSDARRPASATMPEEARIVGVRDGDDGGEDYKVSIPAAEGSETSVRSRLEAMRVARLVSLDREGGSLVAVLESRAGYDAFAEGLKGAGFGVR